MKRVAGAVVPPIALDRKCRVPMHRQLYDWFRRAVLEGQLRPGTRIPSTRDLATDLRISRIPVLNAYVQLIAEGYFESRRGAGTFVSSSLPEQMTSVERADAPSIGTRSGRRQTSKRSGLLPSFKGRPWVFGWGAFSINQVALDHFPFQVWSSLVTRHSKNVRLPSLHFSGPMGSETFRGAIASYLRTARAVNCDARQIMIVSGSQQALDISARVLLDPGDSIWFEEPGYGLARSTFALAGCRIISVPVDEEGLDVSAGVKLCRKARVAYVTPSHQFPLGATMSASRRLQLLEWARQAHAWIIEDDYDSEYRYKEMPITSLQGLDRSSRVIYIGTFSKTLFPSLRVGYIVIPPDLIDRFVAVRLAMDIYPSHLYQAVLHDFINEGHLARHIRRTRLLYAERRRVLVDAIATEFGAKLQILGSEAGTHMAVTTPRLRNDRKSSELAASQKLWVWPLSTSYFSRPPRQGFILGFGSTQAHAIPRAVSHLRKVLEST